MAGSLIRACALKSSGGGKVRPSLTRTSIADTAPSGDSVVDVLPPGVAAMAARSFAVVQLRVRGLVGSTVRPKVALVTSANDAYQAAAAVASPTYPPQ